MKEVPQLTKQSKQQLTFTSYCVGDMAKGKNCNIMHPTQKLF